MIINLFPHLAHKTFGSLRRRLEKKELLQRAGFLRDSLLSRSWSCLLLTSCLGSNAPQAALRGFHVCPWSPGRLGGLLSASYLRNQGSQHWGCPKPGEEARRKWLHCDGLVPHVSQGKGGQYFQRAKCQPLVTQVTGGLFKPCLEG